MSVGINNRYSIDPMLFLFFTNNYLKNALKMKLKIDKDTCDLVNNTKTVVYIKYMI